MSKKWYEYLLSVRQTTDTGVMDHNDIDEVDEEEEANNHFAAVPAGPVNPAKAAVVAAAVTEAFNRTASGAPPAPSNLPIMSPVTKPSLAASNTPSNPMETLPVKPPSAAASQSDLKLQPVALIYDDAHLAELTHGYSALKVVTMLKSEHLRNMPTDAKRSSILLALEASGTKLQDVVDDALRRIRLLQQQERDSARSLEALERRKVEENQNIAEELAKIVQEYNQRIQSNTEQVARTKAQFLSWRMEVKEEEQKISEALSYFTGQSLIVKEHTEANKGEKS